MVIERRRHRRNESKMVMVIWLQHRPPDKYFSVGEIARGTGLSYGYVRARCAAFSSWNMPLLRKAVIRPDKGRPCFGYCLSKYVEHHTRGIKHWAVLAAQEHFRELSQVRVRELMARQQAAAIDRGVPTR